MGQEVSRFAELLGCLRDGQVVRLRCTCGKVTEYPSRWPAGYVVCEGCEGRIQSGTHEVESLEERKAYLDSDLYRKLMSGARD